MNPTKWWKHTDDDGETLTVARWYWPDATRVDMFLHDGSTGWSDPLPGSEVFLEITDDPSWVEIGRDEAEQWIAAQNPS